MSEFYDEWAPVLYAAVRNSIRTNNYDEIMDALTFAFCLHYDGISRSFHPDYHLEFSNYVVISVKKYAIKYIMLKANRPTEHLAVEVAACNDLTLDLPDSLTDDERWLAFRLMEGWKLTELSQAFIGYNYGRLRALKRSLREKL